VYFFQEKECKSKLAAAHAAVEKLQDERMKDEADKKEHCVHTGERKQEILAMLKDKNCAVDVW